MVVPGARLLAVRSWTYSRVCTFVRSARTRQHCAGFEHVARRLLLSNCGSPITYVWRSLTIFRNEKWFSAEPDERETDVAMGEHRARPPGRWGAFLPRPDGIWLRRMVMGQIRFWQSFRPVHTSNSDAWPHRNGDRHSNCICRVLIWNF